jgi:large subunit ribosomal protein L4
MISLPIYNTQAQEIDKVQLEPKIFDGKVNFGSLYQAVLMYRANQRRGLASTKTRGEVSGGGRKPWRQKGTGRARVGSIRSPLWRSGGVVFGPHPRDYSYSIPAKAKLVAIKSSLNAKVNDKAIIVLDKMEITEPKTKEIVKILSNFKELIIPAKGKRNLLLLLDKIDKKINLATSNLNYVDVCLANNATAYQILKARDIILTKGALIQLVNRIKNGLGKRKLPKIRTEKAATLYEPYNKYLFLVDKYANKFQIKKAVEEIYKVSVRSVNSLISQGKMKRVRYQIGKTSDSKKAIVTLKEGSKIELT